MRTQQGERTSRLCPAQGEFFSMFVAQGFRHKQVTVKPVRQTKSGCNPERQPNIDVAQGAAYAWPKNKTKTERHADHTERSGAFLFRYDVGNISHRCWNA